MVEARYITDPACSASWGTEPQLRKLMVEFGAEVSFTYVMGGLAREYQPGYDWLVQEWLAVSDATGMPTDPLLWHEGPLRSTYPACMAVKAAAEQGDPGPYLRRLREGILCLRRKLDTVEPLVEQARAVGLETERFRIDLDSNATVEAFGADLEEARTIPDEARGRAKPANGGERVPFPTVAFTGEDGRRHWVIGDEPYEAYSEAALAAGASPVEEPPPAPLEALRRLGRMAAVEVEAVCDLPAPRAHAELWRLVEDHRAKPVRAVTGWLFEPA